MFKGIDKISICLSHLGEPMDSFKICQLLTIFCFLKESWQEIFYCPSHFLYYLAFEFLSIEVTDDTVIITNALL